MCEYEKLKALFAFSLTFMSQLLVPTCICPFPLVGSQLFARGVNLNWPIRAQSGPGSLRVSDSRRRRAWSTHSRVAVCSNIIQVFYDKKGSCDHFGGFE